jgi:NAD-dependent deacetylase
MLNDHHNQTIDSIVRILKKSRSILFITGAGISAESGIPTYRGVGGLYNMDVTDEGFAIEEVLSATMLAENPALTWKYLAQIGLAVQGATFNRAHKVIAEMESHFLRVWTLTQNVDGFHRDAGSKNLVEAHGNMHSLSCVRCSYRKTTEQFEFDELPPKCPRCGGLIRPDVVLFGELIDGDGVRLFMNEMQKGFDVVFSIGTSSVFPYNQAPLHWAKSQGIPTIEINPSESIISGTVDYRLDLPAIVSLDTIWTRYQSS